MYGATKAVIFDMDGVLINSEPLWRRAMIKGFKAAGIDFTEEDCRKTTGRRINEVVDYWLNHHQTGQINALTLERVIIEELLTLIDKEGEAIEGIREILALCESRKFVTGLATSSSNELVNAVLKKLNLSTYFKALTSAEFLKYGKPHPEVFLTCAELLNVLPFNCLVIEDSINGVIAAKAAQMKVIAVPDAEHLHLNGFHIADFTCKNMQEALHVLKNIQ
jgi:mannitol-1-/sugar-/sorbitol-6-/2-deoxyglucose-6-phosphatase